MVNVLKSTNPTIHHQATTTTSKTTSTMQHIHTITVPQQSHPSNGTNGNTNDVPPNKKSRRET